MIAIGDLELHSGAALSTKPLLRLSPKLFNDLNAVHLASKLSENIRDGVGAVPAAASSVPKYQHADRRCFPHERHTNQGVKSADVGTSQLVVRISSGIGNVNRGAFK